MLFVKAAWLDSRPRPVHFIGELIEWVDTARYLAVTLDSRLSWWPHIVQVRKKAPLHSTHHTPAQHNVWLEMPPFILGLRWAARLRLAGVKNLLQWWGDRLPLYCAEGAGAVRCGGASLVLALIWCTSQGASSGVSFLSGRSGTVVGRSTHCSRGVILFAAACLVLQ
jgi:hypothetical protein